MALAVALGQVEPRGENPAIRVNTLLGPTGLITVPTSTTTRVERFQLGTAAGHASEGHLFQHDLRAELLIPIQGQSLQLPPSLRFPPLREGNRVGRVGSVPHACRGNLKEGVIGHTRFCELWLRDWYNPTRRNFER